MRTLRPVATAVVVCCVLVCAASVRNGAQTPTLMTAFLEKGESGLLSALQKAPAIGHRIVVATDRPVLENYSSEPVRLNNIELLK